MFVTKYHCKCVLVYFVFSFTNTLLTIRSIQDPKTSRWLWDIRERSRQKERTEHYREIMKMQQDKADPLELITEEDDSQDTKEKLEMMTRLSDEEQMGNYLSYGKWDLTPKDIARLEKDDEMKQRVSITFTVRVMINAPLIRQVQEMI